MSVYVLGAWVADRHRGHCTKAVPSGNGSDLVVRATDSPDPPVPAASTAWDSGSHAAGRYGFSGGAVGTPCVWHGLGLTEEQERLIRVIVWVVVVLVIRDPRLLGL